MENNNIQKIKNENKKAGKTFIIICIVAFIVGGVAGGVLTMADNTMDFDSIAKMLHDMLAVWGPTAMTVLTIILSIIGFAKVGQARRTFKKWDGEDEQVIAKAEKQLGVALLMSTLIGIISYFLAAASFAVGSLWGDVVPGVMRDINLILWFVGFIGCLVSVTVLQKKAVDLAKEINPEKNGSVYDMKFQKKWEESCDEAEKLKIYKSAFSAYKATNSACIAVWLVLFLLNMVFNTGVMPILVVCVLWAVLQIAYYIESVKQ